MTSGKKFNVAAGAMTYWTLGQQTDPVRLANGLTALGLPKYNPAPRSWLMSLKAALAQMFDRPEELVRPLKHKERNGYIVVVEEKGDYNNSYSRKVGASADPNTGEAFVNVGDCDQAELQRLTNHFRRVLPAASVSAMLTDMIRQELDGITLKDNGGLYFIPEEHVGKWMDLCHVVENAAVQPTTNDMSVVPLEMNEMTMRDIKRQITAEMERDAGALEEELRTNNLGTDALVNRVHRAADLQHRIERYEQILGETLAVCREKLAIAVSAFAVATAEKEDGEVFDGIFGGVAA